MSYLLAPLRALVSLGALLALALVCACVALAGCSPPGDAPACAESGWMPWRADPPPVPSYSFVGDPNTGFGYGRRSWEEPLVIGSSPPAGLEMAAGTLEIHGQDGDCPTCGAVCRLGPPPELPCSARFEGDRCYLILEPAVLASPCAHRVVTACAVGGCAPAECSLRRCVACGERP